MLKWIMLGVLVLENIFVIGQTGFWMTRAFPERSMFGYMTVFTGAFLLVELTMFLCAVRRTGSIQSTLHQIGNFWLGFFINLTAYYLIADAVLGAVTLIVRRFGVHISRIPWTGRSVLMVVFALSLGLVIYGRIHAEKITLREYEVTIPKSVPGIEKLDVVLIADQHLGYSIGCKETRKMVDMVKKLKPDLILYGGDQFDNNFDALDDEEQLAELLGSMKAKYGTYAVFGNHDVTETLVGGFPVSDGENALRDPRMDRFMESIGAVVLDDEIASICDGRITLIGRKNASRPGDGTHGRRPLSELIDECDTEKPVFVIDHEPKGLKEDGDSGIDLVFGAHTHAGQFFPLTVCQPFAWENSKSMKTFGDMVSVVTQGVGVYGPKMRVGTNAEVVKVTVRFS